MKTKKITLLVLVSCGLLAMSCNSKSNEKKQDEPIYTSERKVEEIPKNDAILASETIDLNNKGIGPIKSLILSDIDKPLATKGQEIFKNMCTACHKPTKKFIGPAPKGILERRTPEWVMNMILNPENMIANDPLAKELLKEFNGAPMANQNLSEEDARAVLEYFRTL